MRTDSNCRYKSVGAALLAVLLIVGLASLSFAMPPHPDLRAKIAASKITESLYLDQLQKLRAMGVDAPDKPIGDFIKSKASPRTALASTPYKMLAVLVDFSDNTASVAGSGFDDLLFDSVGTSVKSFYDEVSNSQLDLLTLDLPSTTGWYRAPQTYAYYVDGQYGLGTYPQNTQKLVEDLVDAANPDIDFSQYDNDGDHYVDALIVIHAGPGREFTGSPDDIHSHKWGINPRPVDGVYVSSYTIQPEYMNTPGDQTIGVFCHELGHIFGLPDLYDTDESSRGVGAWCLMAYGSWNGSNGSSPSYPSAWCRQFLGFSNVVNVASNGTGQIITAAENGGSIYRLWNSGDSTSSEYFLVENRQKTGYDYYLPSAGLLIWHVDESKLGPYDNDQEWYPGLPATDHYAVALEQADGLYQLEHSVNVGNSGDPYPGSTGNTSFGPSTSPSSDSYLGGSTLVAVQSISASLPAMTADLIVGLAASVDDDTKPILPQHIELAQNYPNPFNPTTRIEFSVTKAGPIRLDIFNIAGQKVRTLFDSYVGPGVTTVDWDALDSNGNPVASGVYFYRLQSGDHKEVKKMTFVR